MQYDAAKGDKNGDGGEHDGRDSPSLMAIGYFASDVAGLEFWVAVPENSGEISVHSGGHEFGPGSGGGLNGSRSRRWLALRKSPHFPRRSEYLQHGSLRI
jgi:hypothetical protein